MDASFEPTEHYQLGSSLNDAALADLNGDGVPDLVVSTQDGIAELLGTGTGGFDAPHLITNEEAGPIAVGDLTGKGNTDVVYSDHGVSVLLENGYGGFGAPVISAFTAPVDPFAFILADVNGDGTITRT